LSSAIKDLEAKGQLTHEDVEGFLASHSFPIVEGKRISFVYHGEAEEVRLRNWIHGLPSSEALTRIPGSALWFHAIDLPAGSRMEYKFEVTEHGDTRLLQDALNPHLARDPFGANSVVHGEGYEVPDWTFEDTEARPGKLEQRNFHSDALQRDMSIQVYLPARFREARKYPLLVVHDGSDFLRFALLETVLNNLIHRQEIPPMIVAFVDSDDRINEYGDSQEHARFLCDELLPELEASYPLIGTPQTRCLMGASFGAVATLAAAWRHARVFDNLFLLSGSFVFTDIGPHDFGPLFDRVVKFVNAFREQPDLPARRIYQVCGIYESLISYNRSMLPVLQEAGVEVRYAEVRDGHNWENWRDQLRQGLSWIFPGPLWMVYE
jgi:enterochelin esterase-like enzyme